MAAFLGAEGNAIQQSRQIFHVIYKLEKIIFKGQMLINLAIDCISYLNHFLNIFFVHTTVRAKEINICKITHASRIPKT